jgi:hypothetical protein
MCSRERKEEDSEFITVNEYYLRLHLEQSERLGNELPCVNVVRLENIREEGELATPKVKGKDKATTSMTIDRTTNGSKTFTDNPITHSMVPTNNTRTDDDDKSKMPGKK